MNFEEYLISKKIDSAAFLGAEPERWKTWRDEFEQIHPNSFTAQKLYLINPLRRKYLLKEIPKEHSPGERQPSEKSADTATNPETPAKVTPAANPKPAIPRPVFKPKPKIN